MGIKIEKNTMLPAHNGMVLAARDSLHVAMTLIAEIMPTMGLGNPFDTWLDESNPDHIELFQFFTAAENVCETLDEMIEAESK